MAPSWLPRRRQLARRSHLRSRAGRRNLRRFRRNFAVVLSYSPSSMAYTRALSAVATRNAPTSPFRRGARDGEDNPNAVIDLVPIDFMATTLKLICNTNPQPAPPSGTRGCGRAPGPFRLRSRIPPLFECFAPANVLARGFRAAPPPCLLLVAHQHDGGPKNAFPGPGPPGLGVRNSGMAEEYASSTSGGAPVRSFLPFLLWPSRVPAGPTDRMGMVLYGRAGRPARHPRRSQTPAVSWGPPPGAACRP